MVADIQQLTLPGIDFAPPKVRRYGLREAHSYPLVSHGKDVAGNWRGSFRVPAARAWTFPELEIGRGQVRAFRLSYSTWLEIP